MKDSDEIKTGFTSAAEREAAVDAAVEQQIADIYAAAYGQPSTADAVPPIEPLNTDGSNNAGARPEDDLPYQYDAPGVNIF